MDPDVALKFLSNLLTPSGLLVVGVVFSAIVKLAFKDRWYWWPAAAGSVAFHPASDLLVRPLEERARQAARAAPPCCYDAIVVLSGGIVSTSNSDVELGEAADRVLYAAQLFKRGLAPRIVTTGATPDNWTGHRRSAEAEIARRLLQSFGIPPDQIMAEERSRNTFENLQQVQMIQGKGKIALVTSAFHMPRSLQIARRLNLDVAAFPTDWRAIPEARSPWEQLLPNQVAPANAALAMKEYAALLLDWRSR